MKSVKVEIVNPEINWSKIQLLRTSDGDVVLSNGNHKGGVFEGTAVNTVIGSHFSVGYYSDSWNKSAFKPFDGKIELSNS